jgi:hypothetical protein
MVMEFISTSEAIKVLGLRPRSATHIQECCVGKRESAYGRVWKYKAEEIIEGERWAMIGDSSDWLVSDHGRVRGGRGSNITFGYGARYSGGYNRVKIAGKNILVHALVMRHFGVPCPVDLHVINHIDGNKLNNHIENLEWLSKRDNVIHGINLRKGR